MRTVAVTLLCAALAGSAYGEKVVVGPLNPLTDGVKDVTVLQKVVLGGLAGVPGFEVVPEVEWKKAVKLAKRPELERCEGEAKCLAELAKLVGAQRAVAGDVGELAEGHVVYLKAVGAADGREMGSTTAVFPVDVKKRDAEARGAAFRLLAPDRYVGKLALNIDVSGARVHLDGQEVARAPVKKPLALSVGTHALRITHDQYRDYVRFVDIKFDERSDLSVNLKAYPVISDEMREKEKLGKLETIDNRERKPRPWYRTYWAVGGVAAVLLVGTAVIVMSTTGGVDADGSATVEGPPTP